MKNNFLTITSISPQSKMNLKLYFNQDSSIFGRGSPWLLQLVINAFTCDGCYFDRLTSLVNAETWGLTEGGFIEEINRSNIC